MSAKYLLPVVCCIAVAACSSEEADLVSWMNEQEQSMVRHVDPLPTVKTFPVVDYAAADLVEPFAASRIVTSKGKLGGPDLNRQREPLEAFALESLSMVGLLKKSSVTHALVRAGTSLYQVKIGNYMGQDHGIVTQIGEAEMTVVELVEDLQGDWSERTSTIVLQER